MADLNDHINHTLRTIEALNSVHGVGTIRVLEPRIINGERFEIIKKRPINILALKAIARHYVRSNPTINGK